MEEGGAEEEEGGVEGRGRGRLICTPAQLGACFQPLTRPDWNH